MCNVCVMCVCARARVCVALSQFAPFAETFSCPADSMMAPGVYVEYLFLKMCVGVGVGLGAMCVSVTQTCLSVFTCVCYVCVCIMFVCVSFVSSVFVTWHQLAY